VEEKGSDFVQIKSPSEHLSKRQATLQVMFRGTGDQPRLAIIFAGAGKVYNDSPGLAGAEKAYMDNLIHSKTGVKLELDVYFNEKAWADAKFTNEWMARSMKRAVSELMYTDAAGNMTKGTDEKGTCTLHSPVIAMCQTGKFKVCTVFYMQYFFSPIIYEAKTSANRHLVNSGAKPKRLHHIRT